MPFPGEGLYPDDGQPPGGDEATTEASYPSNAIYPSDSTYPGYLSIEGNASDAVTGSDAVARHLVLARSLSESRTTFDVVTRRPAYVRTRTETVTGSDTVGRTLALRRSATEAIPTSDAAKALPIYRRVTESRVTTDAVARKVSKFRSASETIPTSDTVAHHAATRLTRGTTEALTTSDAAEAVVVPEGPPQGRPVVTIDSIDRIKISHVSGFDRALISFTVSKPVPYWTARANSTGPFDGFEVDKFDGAGPGFGMMPFGSSPFGDPSQTVQGGVVEVDSNEVLIGDNDIAVYARDLSGAFS